MKGGVFMPNIQSAKKKARQDKKRTARNNKQRRDTKNIVNSVTAATLGKAYSLIDKAVKKKIIHKNKAARLKARVSKLARKK